jgi:ADP-ribose pyrophosphatase YjhB (NUDIX family)
MRQLRDDIGLEIDSAKLITVYSGPRFETTYANGDEVAPVISVFFVETFDGASRATDETDTIGFYALDALPRPLRNSTRLALDDYRRYLSGDIRLPIVGGLIAESDSASAQPSPDYIQSIRHFIGNDLLQVPSTACIVVNERGEVLLQLRADLKRWGCPGGILDIGETVTQCVRREVREETGIDVDSLTLFGVYAGPRYRGHYPNGDETSVVQFVFIAATTNDSLRIDDESLDLRFFAPSALPENLAPHHEEFLGHYVEYLSGEREIPVVL